MYNPAITQNNKTAVASALTNPVLWIVFTGYILLLGWTGAHHELWGDEIHSWNIARASTSFSSLLENVRYEGHPPAWHTLLWFISRCTDNLVYVQVAHELIAALVVFILLFFSPLPLIAKMLIPFGYYFLFEYAVLDRDYSIGVLAAFCL